mgnify:CR=1 FL=1
MKNAVGNVDNVDKKVEYFYWQPKNVEKIGILKVTSNYVTLLC